MNHKEDPNPALFKQADIGEIKGYLRDCFGISEDALSGYRFPKGRTEALSVSGLY